MPTALIIDQQLEKRVRGYVSYRVPKEDAEDVVQDAWLKIVQDWPSYDPQKQHDPENASVGVFARYRCLSAIRDYYRRRPPASMEEPPQLVAPSSRSAGAYDRLLAVTFAAPSELHQLIVFGYVHLLEWKPAEIVAELAEQALEDLGNRFVVEYSTRFTRGRNRALDRLRPFTERLRGQRAKLADHFSTSNDPQACAAEVTRWRYTVLRRLGSDLRFLHGLEAVLTSPRPRHEQIAYGLIELLGRCPRALVYEHGAESLERLAELWEAGCETKKRHLQPQISQLFRPLRQDPALKDRTLCEAVPGGRSPTEALLKWCQDIRQDLHSRYVPRGARS